MPQLFHVLNCYKCAVFQVHQIKKSSKWECKLCGEKQSMKRHYGLGTGKECRLHVQKLNGIRGEMDENNDTGKQNESSDEETKVKHDTKVPYKKSANVESKWSEFVENTEDLKQLEPNKAMYLGNTEVVLEIPAKRRKFTIPKTAKNAPAFFAGAAAPNTYPSKSDDFDINGNPPESPSPPPIQFYERQMSNIQNKLTEIINEDKNIMPVSHTHITSTSPKKQHLNTFVPHKVDKDSKWAQFADELVEDDLGCAECNVENSTVTDDELNHLGKRMDENIPKHTLNIFSLCDENDLDDVLDF